MENSQTGWLEQSPRRAYYARRGIASYSGSVMALFRYKAVNAHGTLSQGQFDAVDTRSVVARLQAMGLIPVSIEEPAGHRSSQSKKIYLQRVTRKDILFFTEELSTLTHAGRSEEHTSELQSRLQPE